MLGSDDTTKTPTVQGPPTATNAPSGAATPPSDATSPPPGPASPPPGPASPPPGPTTPPPVPPAWSPPRAEHDRTGPLVFGAIVLLIGLWFFATVTLGLDLPRISWGQLWPVILIGIGILIVLRAFRRAG